MTLSNVQLNNAIVNKNTSSQSLASQSSSAANVISAFKASGTGMRNALQQTHQMSHLASQAKAYKDSYGKYQRESSNINSLSLKPLSRLYRILEKDEKEDKTRKVRRDNSKAFDPVDFLA